MLRSSQNENLQNDVYWWAITCCLNIKSCALGQVIYTIRLTKVYIYNFTLTLKINNEIR